MTVINGIEIDDAYTFRNETTEAIRNNDPLDILHVIMVISNPCQFARRYILAKQFRQRMEETPNILLYIVELAYGDQKFHVSDSRNKRHLQIHGDVPVWHKENMINMGVKLLPQNWKAMAWIDADIEFDSPSWALDTLKILNGSKDIVQLFGHIVNMDRNEDATDIFPGFGFQYMKKREYGGIDINHWHPGYAWACTRKAYDKMGGLYQSNILGAGDLNMALSLIGNSVKSLDKDATSDYKNSLEEFQRKASGLRLGYVPGVIRHYFHGSKKNRKYLELAVILAHHKYEPSKHIMLRSDGLLIPTSSCPQKLLDEILNYFAERNEDESYKTDLLSPQDW